MPTSPNRHRVEIPTWLYEQIKRTAEWQQRPIAQEITRALTKHYKLEGRTNEQQ